MLNKYLTERELEVKKMRNADQEFVARRESNPESGASRLYYPSGTHEAGNGANVMPLLNLEMLIRIASH